MYLLGTRPTAPQKYSGSGGFCPSPLVGLGVPVALASTLAVAANFGLSAATWKTYGTARRHIAACREDTGKDLRFPFNLGDTLTFIAWLKKKRKVRSKTIKVYMAGIRMAHLCEGFEKAELGGDLVSQVVRGLEQEDRLIDKVTGRRSRMPVTLDIMRAIRVNLRRARWDLPRKRLVWVVATLAFSGSFRIHELLSHFKGRFDPTSTLLMKDIKINMKRDKGKVVKVLQVHLKSPKEAKGKEGVVVDVFETNSYLCPVLAMNKYLVSLGFLPQADLPAFRTSQGQGYTGASFNEDLKAILKETVDWNKHKLTSHSFRAGLATELAKLGYSDQAIMLLGRWRSDAFLHYVKTARTKRMNVVQEVAKKVLGRSRGQK